MTEKTRQPPDRRRSQFDPKPPLDPTQSGRSNKSRSAHAQTGDVQIQTGQCADDNRERYTTRMTTHHRREHTCRTTNGGRLDAGRYYGAVDGRYETPHAVISQVMHCAPRTLPEHDHALAYFCMLVAGDYVETIAGREFDYELFEVGFHPPRMPHRDVIGRRGGRFLCLEVCPAPLAASEIRMRDAPVLLPGDVSLQLLRAYRAFAAGVLSPLMVESVVWELCGDLSDQTAVPERRRPGWLTQCLDLIEEECAAPLTVIDIAARIGVHPVHLSREFRRRFGQTVGEYAHKVRIRIACAMMKQEPISLALVAASVGFADQSHFCRIFKTLVGCTPSAFAAEVRSTRHRAMVLESPGQ